MLTVRTIRLQSRIPAFRLEYPLLQKCSACRLGSIVAQSRFSQQHATQHRQQIRPYLYIPVSWTEVRERLERWLERSDSRIVQVILLKRLGRKVGTISPPLCTSRNISKSTQQRENYTSKIQQQSHHGTVTKWKHVRSQLRNRYQGLPLPYLQSSMSSSSSKVRKIANDYQRWKDRGKEQYGMLKSKYKSRRQAQYQRWNTKRNQVWVKMQRVLVEEYSKKEWFDELGRPLTARDSTGRFVNPWQSQSTNGVHSLTTILRWRWQRFVRENITFLPTFTVPTCTIRSGETNTNTFHKTSPLLTQAVPPLPAPNDSNLQFTWIGHSTCLFQVKNNFTILTDPIFSRRASPFTTFLGVRRDVPPAYTIEELANHQMKYCSERDGDGKFDICCITHDHYDHLDTESVNHLRDCVHLWVVPSGIGDWLVQSCSVQPSNIVELQWWQQLCVVKTKGRVVILDAHDSGEYGDDDILTITCCPSSHWSSRTLFDRNMVRRTLENAVFLVKIRTTDLTRSFPPSACGALLPFRYRLSTFFFAVTPVSGQAPNEYWLFYVVF